MATPFWTQTYLGKGITDKEQESKKIIIMDNRISNMLSSLYKTWRNIETDSRRPKRASGPAFAKKLKNLKDTLEMPLQHHKGWGC